MISNVDVLSVLMNNGVNEDYLSEMGGVESGSDEWMEIISEVLGKDSYVEEFSDSDNDKIMEFISVMEGMGIELI